jgi:aminoglycoside/choline kinase family phosphotransferase
MAVEDLRAKAILLWLNNDLKLAIKQLTSASDDASFRRYFRIELAQGARIIMDAPPEKENIAAFINVAKLFADNNLHVPCIYEKELAQGFLLLEDFGNRSFLDVLTIDSADTLYRDALNSLFLLQSKIDVQYCDLPKYDTELLDKELTIFEQWYISSLCEHSLSQSEVTILKRTRSILIASANQQPSVCVHRDYHSRNLMYLKKDNPGIIDFQDAVIGPVCYDLVSLLRDCYIEWPEEKITHWLDAYYQRLLAAEIITCNRQIFQRWFDLMGMQRHLKAIGIFARLKLRDNKTGYLQDIPRTMNYVLQVCRRYPEFSEFEAFIRSQLLPQQIFKS